MTNVIPSLDIEWLNYSKENNTLNCTVRDLRTKGIKAFSYSFKVIGTSKTIVFTFSEEYMDILMNQHIYGYRIDYVETKKIQDVPLDDINNIRLMIVNENIHSYK